MDKARLGNPTTNPPDWSGWREVQPIDQTATGDYHTDSPRLAAFAERVLRVNRRHDPLYRLRGMTARRAHRSPDDRVEIDSIKAPGRRFGPTPLRLLLGYDGSAARPLTALQRTHRYAAQKGTGSGMLVTPRQARRIRKKMHNARSRGLET